MRALRLDSRAASARERAQGLTSPSAEHAREYLELEHEASSPYTRFVYAGPDEARATHRYLYAERACEFGPPFAQVLLDPEGVVAAAALLAEAELTRSRFQAALSLGRVGLFRDDVALQRRMAAASGTLLRPEPADLYVSRFAVAERARGRGVGRRLLSQCEAVARRRGCRRLVLEVSTEHEAALSLYLRAGFDEIGRRRAEDAATGRELVYLHLAKRLE
ncbi:MAG: GNAT family N-acetyltransferase [Myxococcota bacterium]|nr:GNAT family N-acetyltransferase [Myxococcota bacterium]